MKLGTILAVFCGSVAVDCSADGPAQSITAGQSMVQWKTVTQKAPDVIAEPLAAPLLLDREESVEEGTHAKLDDALAKLGDLESVEESDEDALQSGVLDSADAKLDDLHGVESAEDAFELGTLHAADANQALEKKLTEFGRSLNAACPGRLPTSSEESLPEVDTGLLASEIQRAVQACLLATKRWRWYGQILRDFKTAPANKVVTVKGKMYVGTAHAENKGRLDSKTKGPLQGTLRKLAEAKHLTRLNWVALCDVLANSRLTPKLREALYTT